MSTKDAEASPAIHGGCGLKLDGVGDPGHGEAGITRHSWRVWIETTSSGAFNEIQVSITRHSWRVWIETAISSRT